ncbi:MAG: exopolysaccharide biosynthesis polyprenyl glycosylphosphotransferase [Pyrinomonadaceae bacterium]|nr:exopolysaccharide biosynthesis polyprenyl glycosylphosphotransferase [Sphingobacteriaceae bacterium]
MRYLFLLRFILVISDLILVNILFFVSAQLSSKFGGHIDENTYRQNLSTCNLIWLLCTGLFRLYGEQTILKLESIYRATWRSIALHSFLFLAYLFFTYTIGFPRYFVIIFYSCVGFGFLFSRFMGTALQNILIQNFDIRKAVAVLGMNPGGLKLAAYLEQQSNMNFVGFLGKEGYYVDPDGQLLPAAIQQLREASKAGVKEIFVSLTPDRLEDIPQFIKEGEKQCVRLKFVPDLTTSHTNFRIDHIGGFPILCLRKEPLEDIENRFKKRFLDVTVSIFILLFVFSWLYPILAILIKLQSPGPVLVKQLRNGKNNQPFWCYRFRSLRMNYEGYPLETNSTHQRFTSIGKFIQRTGLNELPQLFNVVMGSMSLIGPRPHMLSHEEEYRLLLDKYMVRQFLKPGITGWAQVNGFKTEAEGQFLMEKQVEHDIWYLENWSAMLDVRIMFTVVINIFRKKKEAS